jgi:predicted permease
MKSPGFTIVAIMSLALGIGANTTVFCWIQNVLLRPLPGVHDPGRMVVLATTHGPKVWDTVSYPDLLDYGTLTGVFSGVIGSQITPACMRMENAAEWIYGQVATANFFDVLEVTPELGRFFLPEEALKPGGHPVLVISHGFWMRRFGGAAGVVGRTVEMNGHPFTIVGVAPEDFHGSMSGLKCDFWAPLTMHRQVANFGSLEDRADRWLHTQARLAAGVGLGQARAAANGRAKQLEAAYPDVNRELGMKVLPLWQSPYGGQSLFLPVLRVLMAVSLAVLLIVAANVANLLLARATTREKEIAIRLALGAGRVRLIRQLLTESMLLALLGGGLGLLLAAWASNLFRWFVPKTPLPVGYGFELDGRTLLFTLMLTVATGILFGLAPAWQTARDRLHNALKDGGRGAGAGSAHHRLRGALVSSEVALALLLLASAGLCLKGFQKAREVDLGFDARRVLVAGLRIGMNGYDEAEGKVFYRQLRERLVTVPGVTDVGLSSWFPLGFEGGPASRVEPEGYAAQPNEDLSIPYAIVSPGYFATLRIPIVEGRDFTDRDGTKEEGAVIVNEAMARRFWPGENALGRRVRIWGGRAAVVVGVVKTGKYRSLNERSLPFVYYPYQQGVWDLNLGVALRTEGNPATMITPLRREIAALDSRVEIWAALPLEDYAQAAFVGHRIAATLLAVLGSIALVLAAMGIYGVVAFVVGQRTHEIGVRMALGARPGDVVRLVLGHGLKLALIGIVLGTLGSVLVTRFLAVFLHGVSPFDPWTFAGVAGVLGGVTLAACYAPARQAARVDPVVALRQQ